MGDGQRGLTGSTKGRRYASIDEGINKDPVTINTLPCLQRQQHAVRKISASDQGDRSTRATGMSPMKVPLHMERRPGIARLAK